MKIMIYIFKIVKIKLILQKKEKTDKNKTIGGGVGWASSPSSLIIVSGDSDRGG